MMSKGGRGYGDRKLRKGQKDRGKRDTKVGECRGNGGNSKEGYRKRVNTKVKNSYEVKKEGNGSVARHERAENIDK